MAYWPHIHTMMDHVNMRREFRDGFTQQFAHTDGTPSHVRTYHNLDHLSKLWTRATQKLRFNQTAERQATAAFVLYHDVVYAARPRGTGWNERDSALQLIEDQTLELIDVHRDALKRARLGILASAFHTLDQPLHATDIVATWLDADVCELGADANAYAANAVAVRKELGLAHDDPRWITGRKDFLSRMLARRSVFYVMTELEKPARANMQREYDALMGLSN
jgi:predicted metal-dependent HD superfamily phosphohydrolase